MKERSNWFQNPTKKQLIIVLLGFSISIILLLMVATDLFRHSPFHRRSTGLLFMLAIGLIFGVSVTRNYFRAKKVG